MTNSSARPVPGPHTPNCPDLPDGDGGWVECTWWDHDPKLAEEDN